MQHLKELGLELKPTILLYIRNKLLESEKWELTILKDLPSGMFEQIPAYTLQDILDVLPKFITSVYDCGYLNLAVDSEKLWCASYDNYDIGSTLEYIDDESPIDAAYKLLCWAIENGYVEIKTKEE